MRIQRVKTLVRHVGMAKTQMTNDNVHLHLLITIYAPQAYNNMRVLLVDNNEVSN